MGSLRSSASDEKPLPKSSMARRTPRALRRVSTAVARSASEIVELSGTSSMRRSGDVPQVLRTCSTIAGSSRSVSDLGDRFTEKRGSRTAFWRQWAASRSTVLSTQKVSVPMRPVRSAIPMMFVGETSPACAWRQRTSASAPMGRPVPRSMIGW